VAPRQVKNLVDGYWRMGNPGAVLPTGPADPDPLRPVDAGRGMPSRNAAAQRRAMQAALANAVRAMRSTGGRRGRNPSAGRTTRSGGV
jgi:hypothetical protein